ncbi:MAG: acyl-CoA dehydrogenase family protein [Pseudomonadota bacterium]
MPEQLTPELHSIADKAERFAKDTLHPLADRLARGEISAADARAEVIRQSKAAGLYRLRQPAEVGGDAADTLTLVVVRDALAAQNPLWFAEVFGPGPGVLVNAADPLRTTHLLPMLAGDKRGGFGFTEPADAEHYTRAERDGDDVLVTGRKSYVTAGADATFINVLADVGDEGRAFVVVDTDRPGVSHERLFDSIDGTRHAAFRFDGVRVPATHVVDMPGQGMSKAMRQIGDVRIMMAAEAVGRGRWIVDYLTGHLRTHEARKGASEAIRLRYGDLRIKLYAARSALYRAARLANTGANVVNEGIAAKAFATETLSELVDTAMQLVGGAALETEHPLARLHQTTRILRVAEGLTDVLRLNIARGALDLDKGTL